MCSTRQNTCGDWSSIERKVQYKNRGAERKEVERGRASLTPRLVVGDRDAALDRLGGAAVAGAELGEGAADEGAADAVTCQPCAADGPGADRSGTG